jgi:hypothetical protein
VLQSALMIRERRDLERTPILGSLPGEVMVYQPMAILEIGLGGATVETAFPLQLDSLHDLRLRLGERSVVLKGRVVQSQVTDVDQEAVLYRSGLEFIEAPARVRTAIAEYVAILKSQRRA